MVEGLQELRRRLVALDTEAALLKDLSAQSGGHSRQLRRAADRLNRELRKIDGLIEAALRQGAVHPTAGQRSFRRS
jgi:hypothetical protein